ncbi:MAG TPA: flagellar export protein FliJ [Rubrivivax sp.]|nr:flagellar export protein FliJ [Pseudomonadota bacterium]HOL37147.1 flagellar export protein FliJ [Rubrivivax sp.]HPP82316.1 flagellar export protein FliJ [Rubrivivax sp.]
MPANPQPLHLVLERAEAERDAARAHALRAAELARALARQAEQLLAYRAEYRRRAPAAGAEAVPIELVRSHRDFMQRLDETIELQRAQRAAAERDALAGRDALVAAELRVASVRKLIERRQSHERRHASRAEQRLSDDAAQRAAWLRRAGATTR